MPSPRCPWALLYGWLALAGGGRLAAQGVTGAAVQGMVAGADSTPIADATVLVTNPATGERWRTVTRGDGRFVLDHLSVGGPYSLDVRAIGYSPARRTGIFVALGQRLTFDVALALVAVQLPEVSVRGAADPQINAGRTGPAQTISRSSIVGLPIAGRDFTNLALLSPQVSKSPNGLLSVAGLNDRLTSVQVDGTTASSARNEVGTGIAGIPLAGTDFGNFPLPVEAVAALQVSVAPFDVREGGFAGGLIKAISQSGTNQWHGSLYSYFQNEKLSGHNPDDSREDPYGREELGLALGGPIVRDRLAFFLSAGGRRQDFPQPVGSPSTDTTAGKDSIGTGVRYASLLRFQEILRRTYGVDPGSFTTESARAPLRTVFLKLSAQLGVNNRLELSHDYAHVGNRVGGTHQAGLVAFNSNGAADPLDDHATRLNWTAAFGPRWSNDLFLARATHRHQCMANSPLPQVEVAVDAGVIFAGSQFVCDGADDMETTWELTDNVGVVAGSHHLTFGMHGELTRISDDGSLLHVPQPADWSFSSLDSLEQGLPDGYQRFVPGPLLPASGVVEFHGTQLGWYAQDQWALGRRLTVTAGVRLDVALLPTAPTLNVELRDVLGITTARTPSGHGSWSPRLGLNYDVSGRGSTMLRGGIGLFAGRPAYRWLQNAYQGSGTQSIFLQCFGPEDVPAFTLDPAAQPDRCGSAEPGLPEITVFDPAFRFPRDLRLAIGADQRMPWGVVGTVDLLYVRGVDQFALRDVNLLPPVGVASGEGGRLLYGTFDSIEGPTARRRSDAFGPVLAMTNDAGDRSWSLAFQIQKRWSDGADVTASYTYSDARDRQSAAGNDSRANLSYTVIDGSLARPNLRPSLYGQPHKVTLAGTASLPLRIRVGLTYIGVSGHPFTYITNGDPNADGLGRFGQRNNDPVYVPRDASDITLVEPSDYAKLDGVIRSTPCLSAQRGRLVRRNSCRAGWNGRLDARVTKVVPTTGGQTLELTADLFNVLNFVDSDWARTFLTGDVFGGRVPLLDLAGYDAANGRGIYSVQDTPRHEVDVPATRWHVQLSARYTF
jgi:hypothetical protein